MTEHVQTTECIMAIDQGTQSTRVFVYDKDAKPVASHQVDLPQILPRASWCEHDPQIIMDTVQECIAQAIVKAEAVTGTDLVVKALGITNQRETTVVWRKSTGKPCHNAIVWHDTRTRDICHAMAQKYGGKNHFSDITGLPMSTYFSAFKVRWLYEHCSDAAQAMDTDDACIGTVDSWIVYNLTGGVSGGVHVTDVTNASRTFFMDIRTQQWSEPCMAAFGVTASMLPAIRSNSEVLGHVVGGPLAGVPIAGCLGDQQAATLGQRCTEGHGKSTYGSGCFLLVHTGTDIVRSHHGLLTTVAYQLGPDAAPTFALEGSIGVAGLGISWLRDQLGLISSAADSETVALTVPNTGGVYVVPAFSGLLAPYWQDSARGTIVGITASTNRGHIVRAMLEAIAFQVRAVMQAVAEDTGTPVAALRVDGGATSNDLLMQLQADIAQVPVQRPAFQETTSLGAAFAAGLAVGFYTLEAVFADGEQHLTTFSPAETVERADQRFASWKKAAARSYDLDDLA